MGVRKRKNMKKLKLLLPLAAVAAASGAVLPIVSCSCGKDKTTNYKVTMVGNATIDKDKAEKGKEFKGVIKAKENYALVGEKSINSVKVGNAVLTEGTDFTWDAKTSTITIVAEKVTGDITITVTTGTQAVVEDVTGFEEALEDETVAEIVLPEEGITLPATTATDPAMNINRSLTIVGPSSTEKTPLYLSDNESNVGIAIGVDETNEDANGIDVTLKNLDIEYNLIDNNSFAVKLDDFNNSNINIINCNINYLDLEYPNAYSIPTSYGLYISPKNLLGGTINIENSKIWGYAAIYNQGSNIKLTASKSTFEGNNVYPEDSSDFTTVVVADFPANRPTHCFGTNNDFTFSGCEIDSVDGMYDGSKNYHQTVAEIRSRANNHLSLIDNTVCKSLYYYEGQFHEIPDAIKFINVDHDDDFITDSWLSSYDREDAPKKFTSIEEYYIYYGDELKSSMNIDGSAITEAQGYRDADVIDAGYACWDFGD